MRHSRGSAIVAASAHVFANEVPAPTPGSEGARRDTSLGAAKTPLGPITSLDRAGRFRSWLFREIVAFGRTPLRARNAAMAVMAPLGLEAKDRADFRPSGPCHETRSDGSTRPTGGDHRL